MTVDEVGREAIVKRRAGPVLAATAHDVVTASAANEAERDDGRSWLLRTACGPDGWTCECLRSQALGMPCIHTVAVLRHLRLSPRAYCLQRWMIPRRIERFDPGIGAAIVERDTEFDLGVSDDVLSQEHDLGNSTVERSHPDAGRRRRHLETLRRERVNAAVAAADEARSTLQAPFVQHQHLLAKVCRAKGRAAPLHALYN